MSTLEFGDQGFKICKSRAPVLLQLRKLAFTKAGTGCLAHFLRKELEDELDTIDAFVALGGEPDKSARLYFLRQAVADITNVHSEDILRLYDSVELWHWHVINSVLENKLCSLWKKR